MGETHEIGVIGLVNYNRLIKKNTFLTEDDSDDHSVDSQYTSHNDWNDTLHDQFRFQDSNGGDSDSTFGSSIGSSYIGED